MGDWDDEEDGEWEAPMKDNPAFKGEWYVKRISNEAYKGSWEAKKIDNPEYEDDNTVYKYADFGFVGFDLWQVKGGTIFDNVIICDDKAEADAFAAKWKALSEVEKAAKKKEDDTKKDERKRRKTRPTTMAMTRKTRRNQRRCEICLNAGRTPPSKCASA